MRTHEQFDIMDPRNLEYSFKGNPLKKLEDSVKKTVRNPTRLITKPIEEIGQAGEDITDRLTGKMTDMEAAAVASAEAVEDQNGAMSTTEEEKAEDQEKTKKRARTKKKTLKTKQTSVSGAGLKV
jgi:hypothetical protein